MDKDDEERLMEFIEKQVERGKINVKHVEYTELIREKEDEKIKVDLNLSVVKSMQEKMLVKSNLNILEYNKRSNKEKRNETSTSNKRKSALSEILEEEERLKEKKNRKEHWLCCGIVVKVITKSLGEKYYKKKGIVEEIKSNFLGIVRIFDSNDLIKIDQDHLETVIPSEGKLVKIINGAYRGHEAILRKIHVDKFCATLEISSGVLRGRKLSEIQYEDFSKIADKKVDQV